jgi:alkanesulfonate monooxygenase SsuD/methylene tetrahydromethanopterin reductase-like flavin-dependent oxidoreductase (luciferase family)
MRAGWVTVWGGGAAQLRRQIRLAESAGISAIGIGDSPSGWNELYVSLTIAAYETASMTIAPMVAVPFLRHPVIHARAMSSLAELTGGRVIFGLGTGASAAAGTGNRPATQAEMREYMRVTRALLNGEEAVWQGKPLGALKEPRPVPLYYSAWGPKSLEVAGEVADGVIIKIGSSLDAVVAKVAAVRSAAQRAGRDPGSVDVWAYGYASFADTRKAALESISSLLASSGAYDYLAPHATAGVPEETLSKLQELQHRYDVAQHVVPGGPNGTVARELGLLEFLAERTAIAGTPADVAAYLEQLHRAGISAYFALAPTSASPEAMLRDLASCVHTGAA